jgi:hypothetical protein
MDNQNEQLVDVVESAEGVEGIEPSAVKTSFTGTDPLLPPVLPLEKMSLEKNSVEDFGGFRKWLNSMGVALKKVWAAFISWLSKIKFSINSSRVKSIVQKNSSGNNSSFFRSATRSGSSLNQMPLDQALSLSVIGAEKKENNFKKTTKCSTWGIIGNSIIALILIAGILFGGYQWGKHHTHKTDVAEYSAAGLHPHGGALSQILLPSNSTKINSTIPVNPLQNPNQPVVIKVNPPVKPSIPTAPIIPDTPVAPTIPTAPIVMRPIYLPQTQPSRQAYNYPAASIFVTIPNSWSIFQSENNGTVLDISDGLAERGEIIIQAGVQETLAQKLLELQADSSISNIVSGAFHGIPALLYMRTGSSSVNIVLEYKGSIYTFQDGAANEIDGYSVWFY